MRFFYVTHMTGCPVEFDTANAVSGVCYKFVTGPLTSTGAEADCVSTYGGHLASFPDEAAWLAVLAIP